jgi:hypothetical protein
VLANRLLKLQDLDQMPDWQTAFREFWEIFGERL